MIQSLHNCLYSDGRLKLASHMLLKRGPLGRTLVIYRDMVEHKQKTKNNIWVTNLPLYFCWLLRSLKYLRHRYLKLILFESGFGSDYLRNLWIMEWCANGYELSEVAAKNVNEKKRSEWLHNNELMRKSKSQDASQFYEEYRIEG